MILMGANSFPGPLEGVDHEYLDFFGPWDGKEWSEWNFGPKSRDLHLSKSKSKSHIKNRCIGNFMHMSFAEAVFCLLYSVLHVVSFMWFSGHNPSNGPPPAPSTPKWIHYVPVGEGGGGEEGSPFPLLPPSPFVQNNLEINSDMKSA